MKQSKMKKVTRNNLVKFIEMKKAYQQEPEKALLKEINTFIEEVINKDKRFFHKVLSYEFDEDQLKYLMF